VAATKELLMEPTLAAGNDDLRGLRLDLLRRATEIYLGLAYPAGVIPDVVQRRLAWREGCAADELLSAPPFERAGKAPGRPAPVYALRLGNHRYPHMKLQIQPWPNSAGFMLSVNSHDQVSGPVSAAVDAQAFRDLQAENQRLKEAIEEAWDDGGLPTFLRYLRDYIQSRSEISTASDFDLESNDRPNSTDLTPPV
jgi:hypothetical protein